MTATTLGANLGTRGQGGVVGQKWKKICRRTDAGRRGKNPESATRVGGQTAKQKSMGSVGHEPDSLVGDQPVQKSVP